MKPTKMLMLSLTVFLLLCLDNSVFAQRIVASVPVGTFPVGVAVNRLTNRVYVANLVGQPLPPPLIEAPNTVTVIDGKTNQVVDEIVTGLDFQIGLVWTRFVTSSTLPRWTTASTSSMGKPTRLSPTFRLPENQPTSP
jgi:DNA-binding beta-propeller fold protein YncE